MTLAFAVVNGATHANDAVAAQAQSAVTNAYNVAAGQAVAPANDLSGTNLGNRTVHGAYRFTSSAQLTGPLTLGAQGDPNAQCTSGSPGGRPDTRAGSRPPGPGPRPPLSGALGTASHGCVSLSTRAITWLARRIGAGVPLTITA